MKTLLSSLLFGGALVVGGGVARADLQEQMVKMLERQASEIDAAKPDCDKMLDALMKHVDADATLTKQAQDSDKGKSSEQKKAEQQAFVGKYGPRLQAAAKLMAPLRECRANPKMKQWRARLEPRPAK